ncbi:MAG: ribosome rescue protein RqcH [Candidatus Nanohaloarchaea archaeon]
MELTSLDLSILMEDFKQLENGHVQKVYQRGQEFTLEIYVPGDGKKRLILGPSYAFLSKYKRDNPTKPPGFCMELRKHLGSINSIKQRGFDRILEIKSGDYTFIAEIFGRGNFILLKNEKIIGALRQEDWADRTIRTGEEYIYPEPAADPREMGSYFDEMQEGEIVKELASSLSLGGVYAEEICSRVGIDKHTEIEELDEKEKEAVEAEIDNLLLNERYPGIYRDEKDLKRAVPFQLKKYSDLDFEEMESFSKALDEFYYRKEKRKKEKKVEEKYNEKKEGLERQKEQQEGKIQGLKKAAEERREKAELIYENYQVLEEIQSMVENAIEEHGWKATRKKLEEAETEASEMVKSLNEQEEFFNVEVNEKDIRLEPGKDLEAIASKYYDRAKESESKIENAKKALEKTEELLDDLEKEDIDETQLMEDKTKKRKKKWFEKYRWFYSSEDFLVLVGRDTQTNEMLVNKHMESQDLYVHADFNGAPSVVIKDGQEAGEKTIEEAAKAAVTFTKTWKAGIGADDVYYVTPDQVSKEPESGEYLPKGAFIVRGDREYMHNVKVESSIGPYEIEDEVFVPMCGPEEAVKEHCEESIALRPGKRKKSDIAKKIRESFKDNDYDLDLDYIIRALPPGGSEIKG